MRIAVFVFGSRVSPRFDVAQEILLVDRETPDATETRMSVGHWDPAERIGRLEQLGVDVVICGGIRRFQARELMSRGIRVFSWVTGEAEDAVACLLTGQLESGVMTGPAGPCGRWKFRGGVRRGQGGQECGSGRSGGPWTIKEDP